MMSGGLIELSDRDGVSVVRVDRPPANAIDPILLSEALTALERVREIDPSSVVITGTGRFFSGGADLRVVPELSADEQRDMVRGINALFAGWYTFPRPVVTAVNGHAVAGGLILALCGDYRVGPRSGRFGLTEVKVGIPYPSMAIAVVMRELSTTATRRLTLLADLVDSTTARDLGVFDEVVDDERVLSRALEVARELGELPPRTYSLTKRRLREGIGDSHELGFDAPRKHGWATEEARESAERYLDRPR